VKSFDREAFEERFLGREQQDFDDAEADLNQVIFAFLDELAGQG